MNVWAWRFILTAMACCAVYFVPLVRVTKLSPEGQGGEVADSFDAAQSAEGFWEERLLSAIDSASDANAVLALLTTDPAAAGEEHGRRVGVSRGYFLFIRGEGALGAATAKGTPLTTPAGGAVMLSKGPIFGSAVRDASGLLAASEAPSSREYNALANELNRIVEERVVPGMLEMTAGTRVRFVGCAKVADPARFQPPLEVTPILVEAL